MPIFSDKGKPVCCFGQKQYGRADKIRRERERDGDRQT